MAPYHDLQSGIALDGGVGIDGYSAGEFLDSLDRDVMPDDPRERMPLADSPGDELDELRAEVEDQHGTGERVGAIH